MATNPSHPSGKCAFPDREATITEVLRISALVTTFHRAAEHLGTKIAVQDFHANLVDLLAAPTGTKAFALANHAAIIFDGANRLPVSSAATGGRPSARIYQFPRK